MSGPASTNAGELFFAVVQVSHDGKGVLSKTTVNHKKNDVDNYRTFSL